MAETQLVQNVVFKAEFRQFAPYSKSNWSNPAWRTSLAAAERAAWSSGRLQLSYQVVGLEAITAMGCVGPLSVGFSPRVISCELRGLKPTQQYRYENCEGGKSCCTNRK